MASAHNSPADIPVLKGCPKKSVDKEQLEYLRSLHFTWEEIGSLMGTSSKTIQRRAKEYNIKTYSTLPDDSLDQLVRDIISQFPSTGEVMLRGHRQAMKVHM